MRAEDRETDAARWAIRQAELCLEGVIDSRRAWPRPEQRRLQCACLHLASARRKLACGDWQAAILLALKAQASAPRPSRRRHARVLVPLIPTQLAGDRNCPSHTAETRAAEKKRERRNEGRKSR